MAEVEKFLFNRREAALSLGISVRSIDYLIAGGKLEDTPHWQEGFRLPGRAYGCSRAVTTLTRSVLLHQI